MADNLADQPSANLLLPWCIDPSTSWLDYNCWVECELDAGMVLHKQLPQKSFPIDSLAASFLKDFQFTGKPDLAPPKGGVSLLSGNTQSDTIQRMATSTYRFVLKGYGLRAGYQIPIPGILSVGGCVAVPEGKQRGFNRLAGNFAGIPWYVAVWELGYMVTGPLVKAVAPVPPDLANRILATTPLPVAIAAPLSTVSDQQITLSGG